MSKRAIGHLRTDPAMAELIERIGTIRLRARHLHPFESLVHAIIHQQLSGKAASTILARFKALFESDGFPTPLAVTRMRMDHLRTAGLSRAKATYIADVAQRTLDGHVPTLKECRRLSDADLVERLTAIKGVGRWTVEMLLIFNLGRPDVLPVHDLGIRRGYQIAFRKTCLPEPEELNRAGTVWSPFRTTAALYLWRSADLLQGGDW